MRIQKLNSDTKKNLLEDLLKNHQMRMVSMTTNMPSSL